MTTLKLSAFGGMLPAWNDILLPDGQAAYARDCYLFSGTLIGWRQPKLLRELLDSSAKFVYRVPNKETQDTNILASDSKWLEFSHPDTNVMHSPVVQDSFQRYYAASPATRPIYNTYDRIWEDQHWWYLGVPASGCSPGVTITGGGDTTQLGFTAVSDGDGWKYIPAHRIAFVPIIPDGNMLIQSVNWMGTNPSSTIHFRGVVYSDLNGRPYELLATGNEVAGSKGDGQPNSSLIQNGYQVIPDTTYWVGIMTDEDYQLVGANMTGQGVTTVQTYSNGPPDFISATNTSEAASFQMWAELVGASVFTARAYVYTWVTEYGEEGPPSPPTVVNGWSNGTWRVELFTPLPENMGDDYEEDGITKQAVRNIRKTRIYRTISNQGGLTTYFFVAEIPVTQAVYEDTIQDDVIAINQQLTSLYWFEPPEDLLGINAFPNGITVGFRSNEVWFSEAYRPHAWPPGYVLTTEFPIVGIGVCGQAIVVCTQGTPYLINGINPAAMALTKINLTEPCLHRGSIVSTDTTVLYVSQNGLIQISQSGAGGNISEGWISRERWKELTPQKHVRAIKHATSYFAFGAGDDTAPIRDGYTVELSQEDQISFSIWPQPGGHRLGFGQLSSPNGYDIDNILIDAWTGVALLVQNDRVYWYDFTDVNPTIVPLKWRSKLYQALSKKNMAAMRVWFTVPKTTPPQIERNIADPQPELDSHQYGIVRVYADGQLFTTREIRKSGELLRIYSGTAVEMWQFELESRVNISNVQIATSVKELGLI